MMFSFYPYSMKKYIKLGLTILFPLLVYMLPVHSIETRPAPCLFRLLLDKECWGCGITRACINAIHLNIDKALEYNKLVVIVLPLCIGCYIRYLYIQIKNLKGE